MAISQSTKFDLLKQIEHQIAGVLRDFSRTQGTIEVTNYAEDRWSVLLENVTESEEKAVLTACYQAGMSFETVALCTEDGDNYSVFYFITGKGA